MSFAAFEMSQAGRRIRPILHNQQAISRMEALSARGRPALIAVADAIEQVAPALTNTEKQHVGRWLHRLLGPRGWRPFEKKRMPAGGLFSMAAVYRRIGEVHDLSAAEEAAPEAPRDAAARLTAARAAVRRLPVKPLGAAAFIAEKRRAAKREL
jgi:hypothetical protein